MTKQTSNVSNCPNLHRHSYSLHFRPLQTLIKVGVIKRNWLRREVCTYCCRVCRSRRAWAARESSGAPFLLLLTPPGLHNPSFPRVSALSLAPRIVRSGMEGSREQGRRRRNGKVQAGVYVCSHSHTSVLAGDRC